MVPDESPPALNPLGYPSDNFDLSNWSLQLPVNAHGEPSGTATEKTNLIGYKDSDYFYTGSDGAMVFVAPVQGARTSGSDYTRSELREMNGPREAAWTVAQGGTLTAELAVEGVPAESNGVPGGMVIGQVHGQADEMCRLYFDMGTVYLVDDHGGPNNAPAKFLLHDAAGQEPDIPVGERFDYVIRVASREMTVEVFVGNRLFKAVDPVSPVWDGDRMYFKAGVYNGVGEPSSGASTLGSGAGAVAFYRLAVSHP